MWAPRLGATQQRRILAAVLPKNGTSLASYFSQRVEMKKKFDLAIADEAIEQQIKTRKELRDIAETNEYNRKIQFKLLSKEAVLCLEMLDEDIMESRKAYYKLRYLELKEMLKNL